MLDVWWNTTSSWGEWMTNAQKKKGRRKAGDAHLTHVTSPSELTDLGGVFFFFLFEQGSWWTQPRCIYSTNSPDLMHSTIPSSPSPPELKRPRLWNIKEKAKNKIIPQAFYQASAFTAKSKGHVSPPASHRGNYPCPVREQQMIAEYGVHFLELKFVSWEKKGV